MTSGIAAKQTRPRVTTVTHTQQKRVNESMSLLFFFGAGSSYSQEGIVGDAKEPKPLVVPGFCWRRTRGTKPDKNVVFWRWRQPMM